MIIEFRRGKREPLCACGDSVREAVARARRAVVPPGAPDVSEAEWDAVLQQLEAGWNEAEITDATKPIE